MAGQGPKQRGRIKKTRDDGEKRSRTLGEPEVPCRVGEFGIPETHISAQDCAQPLEGNLALLRWKSAPSAVRDLPHSQSAEVGTAGAAEF